jgi:hypothetical protein
LKIMTAVGERMEVRRMAAVKVSHRFLVACPCGFVIRSRIVVVDSRLRHGRSWFRPICCGRSCCRSGRIENEFVHIHAEGHQRRRPPVSGVKVDVCEEGDKIGHEVASEMTTQRRKMCQSSRDSARWHLQRRHPRKSTSRSARMRSNTDPAAEHATKKVHVQATKTAREERRVEAVECIRGRGGSARTSELRRSSLLTQLRPDGSTSITSARTPRNDREARVLGSYGPPPAALASPVSAAFVHETRATSVMRSRRCSLEYHRRSRGHVELIRARLAAPLVACCFVLNASFCLVDS